MSNTVSVHTSGIIKEEIIFKSKKFAKVLETAKASALSDAPVLIYGESGTGKEVVADFIHKNSVRKEERIIKINCVALPENLFESELFGYEAHAFTGAVKQKKGFFELADKGTIFLDEIGEIPLSLQPKLLRVLQEKEILRIGGNIPKKVDFRIISASNKNLKILVQKGLFREDLYYRLNIIELNMPPLRERREDIMPLINHFVKLFAEKYHKKIMGFEKSAIECLENYPWFGNIRELKNIMERLVIFEKGPLITTEFFPDDLCTKARTCSNKSCLGSLKSGDNSGKKDNNLRENIEKQLIENALIEFNGNQVKAAEKLEMHRNTMRLKIKKYEIDVNALKNRLS
ncbi:MAG: sigma-54 dependent transcriptional regulator [Candidatus Wallbacteria bacterium]